jgi:urea transport system substrate-binding protein
MLGKGGMGVVYEGVDAGLKRNVAIKFLPEEVLKKTDVIDRFMREAQVTARLSHPNIIAIFDVSKDDRGCYMVMELLSPASAGSHLKKKGPYPWPVATRIIADCCAALKVAHDAGIVHRDIKPDNILFSQSGVVKLVDFGLVKLMEDDLHLTQSGMLCGTPMYMSPEQASSKSMDRRSDLYSLGATYYALLTGRAPFTGDGVPQILLAHLKDPTPDPRELVSDIPQECVQVLMKAMEKDREVRYQDAAEMSADLEIILTGIPNRNASIFTMVEGSASAGPISGPVLRSGQLGGGSLRSQTGARLSGVGSTTRVEVGAADAARQGRRGFFALAGLGLLALAGGGAYFVRKELRDGHKAPVGDQAQGTGSVVKQAGPPIKVGVLHSLSGPLAVSERPLSDASLLAIEEVNARGGVLGRQLEPVVLDGKSEVTADSAFTHAAARLLEKEKVAVVFGGYGSSGRKFILPYFEKSDQLLFYPAPYEGLEESQNVIYTGSTPNQLGAPAVHYCVEVLKRKSFYLIGTDGLRAHAFNAIIEDIIQAQGGKVVGSHYALVGEAQFAPVVKKIKKSRPDVILNMLVGDSLVSFFKALLDEDIAAATLPVVSFTMGENELLQLGDLSLGGNYVARTRFQAAPGAAADDTFTSRFKRKYGAHRAVSDVMESAYYGVLLWAAAVEKAGSEDVNLVRQALKSQEYVLGGVRIHIDPSTQHAWKVFQIGKISADNTVQVELTTKEPLPPIPYPPPRTRAEWDAFRQELYEKWGKNWANPQKPKAPKVKRRSS